MPRMKRNDFKDHFLHSAQEHEERAIILRNAVKRVIEGNGISKVAKDFGISKSVLQRRVAQYKNLSEEEQEKFTYVQKHGFKKVFSMLEEQMLEEYLLTAARMCYGLNKKQTRKLAYDFGKINSIEMPPSWHKSESAGIEWMFCFLKRHPALSLRMPEATSLSRATSFNAHNVKLFYDNLRLLITANNFTSSSIYNCDETAVTTVHKPQRILAPSTQRQVGKITSGERGILVTLCATICANGSFIPPFMVFPRHKFQDHMLNGSPPGTQGAANPSGWMDRNNFLVYLKHFIKETRSSTENKVLLILDNHDSHCSVDVVNYAKENGVEMLTIPPHCSHRIQPLDITCFGPFKNHYNRTADNWMISNPGRPITIYNIGELVGHAFPLAFTPNNIVKGFQKVGIWPFKDDVFSETDFLMSAVTDREISTSENLETQTRDLESNPVATCSSETNAIISPEIIRPFAKAKPRNPSQRNRRRTTSRILTSTPVKAQIEQQQADKENKRKIATDRLKKRTKKRMQLLLADSSSEEEMETINENDSLESEICEDVNEEILKSIAVGNYVLVKYATKKSVKYYVGRIEDINNGFEGESFVIAYLKKTTGQRFIFPDIKHTDAVPEEDIVMTLPQPLSTGGTSRAAKLLSFPLDLSSFNIS